MGKEFAKAMAAFRELESHWPPKSNLDRVAYSSKPSAIREFKKDTNAIKENEKSHQVQEVVAKEDTSATTDKISESLCSPKINFDEVNSSQPSATLELKEAINGIKDHEKFTQEQELLGEQVAEVATDRKTESLCASKSNSKQDTSQLPETPESNNAIRDIKDNENSDQGQEVADHRNINFDREESANKHSNQKSIQKSAASESDNAGKVQSHCLVTHPCTFATEKCHVSVAEATGNIYEPGKADNSHLANMSNSPLAQGKALQSDEKMHCHDTDDSCSVASSTATSVRPSKRRITIGTAPTFKCGERAEKRREYYTKLERKRQAMETERLQIEAKTKEEQDATLKEFRKNLFIKANPLPSFYETGPPPRAELKKVIEVKSDGTMSTKKISRRQLLKSSGLRPRDIRSVDPSLWLMNSMPSLLVREQAILLNLGTLRAIAMHECVLIFDYNRKGGKNFLKSLLLRLNPRNMNIGCSMPFSLEVVEAALLSRIQGLEENLMEVEPRVAALLQVLPNKLTADVLEQLRLSKQTLVELGSKAGALKQMLLDLLEDPDEIRHICIMGWKSTIKREIGDEECPILWDKQIGEEEEEEIEMLLENYLQRCESCHGQAERLLDSAKEMEDSISVNLSSRRLEVSRVELLLQVGTFCVSVGALVAGIFGMNLKSYLEEKLV